VRRVGFGRLTLSALLIVSCALSALNTGCVVATTATAPAAPLAVSAVRSHAATPSAEPSGSAAASGSADASASTLTTGSAGASATPVAVRRPFVAEMPSPLAGLPAAKPSKDITGPRDKGVPVLMYHIIGTAPAGARHPDLYVSPGDFIEQMNYLANNGYHAVTLQQVYDFWHHRGTLPSKPVVLSFDDGDTPDFTVVAPLLNELHWPGVMNLIVGRHHPRLKPPIIRALIAAGWEIDSHTVTHADLPGLSSARLAFEVGQSRKMLQRAYHVPVNFFCYPSGRFDAAGVAAVKKAGYLGATTTRFGLATPGQPFLMRRVRVSGGEGIEWYARLLSGRS